MTVTPFLPALPTAAAPAPASGDASSGEAPADGGFLDALGLALAAAGAGAVPVLAPAAPALGVAVPASGSSGQSPLVPVAATVAGSPSVRLAPTGGDPVGGGTVSGSPLGALAATGGEQSTAPTSPTVDGSPLPGPARSGGEQPGVQPQRTVDSAPLPGGRAPETRTGERATATAAPTVDPSPHAVATVDGSSAASMSVTGSALPDTAPRTDTPTTTAVLRQVFPEVTRVATQAGPGTHRLSVTLHPDDLGEVKVTLVVRAGAVHVHLAAGSGAAHDALLQGAPELHRLLEVTGGDARVVVRDASAPSAGTGADQHGADPRGQQYAPGTGEGRDADRRHTPARTTPDRPADEPAVPTPTAPRTTVHAGRLDRLM